MLLQKQLKENEIQAGFCFSFFPSFTSDNNIPLGIRVFIQTLKVLGTFRVWLPTADLAQVL
jgi:hypothetical protein